MLVIVKYDLSLMYVQKFHRLILEATSMILVQTTQPHGGHKFRESTIKYYEPSRL